VARFWDEARRIKPRIQKKVIRRKPSARPQRSSALAIGMYTEPPITYATMVMTVNSEWPWKELVA
jgi:DNA modification methylase